MLQGGETDSALAHGKAADIFSSELVHLKKGDCPMNKKITLCLAGAGAVIIGCADAYFHGARQGKCTNPEIFCQEERYVSPDMPDRSPEPVHAVAQVTIASTPTANRTLTAEGGRYGIIGNDVKFTTTKSE
jgi:hypothetical protein